MVVKVIGTLDKMGYTVLVMAWTFDKSVGVLVLGHAAEGNECSSNITFIDIKTLPLRVRHL